MTPERRTDTSFQAMLAEMRAESRARTNSMIRWNVGSIIVMSVAAFLIAR